MMQQAMQQMMQDPAAVDMMINSNPQLRAMLDAQPGMREQLPTMMQSMSDPATMNAVMQMQQNIAQLQVSLLTYSTSISSEDFVHYTSSCVV
jgi:ubiquilin